MAFSPPLSLSPTRASLLRRPSPLSLSLFARPSLSLAPSTPNPLSRSMSPSSSSPHIPAPTPRLCARVCTRVDPLTSSAAFEALLQHTSLAPLLSLIRFTYSPLPLLLPPLAGRSRAVAKRARASARDSRSTLRLRLSLSDAEAMHLCDASSANEARQRCGGAPGRTLSRTRQREVNVLPRA